MKQLNFSNYNTLPQQVFENKENIKILSNNVFANELNYKGEWDSNDSYAKNDVVYYNYCLYVCISNDTIQGIYPSNTSSWSLFLKGIPPVKGIVYDTKTLEENENAYVNISTENTEENTNLIFTFGIPRGKSTEAFNYVSIVTITGSPTLNYTTDMHLAQTQYVGIPKINMGFFGLWHNANPLVNEIYFVEWRITAVRINDDNSADITAELIYATPNIIGEKGEQGEQGEKGNAGEIIGVTSETTTLNTGENASVVIEEGGTPSERTFNFKFGIPRGDKGDVGSPPNINNVAASVQTLNAGESAYCNAYVNGGEGNYDITFNFGVPRGNAGINSAEVVNEADTGSSDKTYSTQFLNNYIATIENDVTGLKEFQVNNEKYGLWSNDSALIGSGIIENQSIDNMEIFNENIKSKSPIDIFIIEYLRFKISNITDNFIDSGINLFKIDCRGLIDVNSVVSNSYNINLIQEVGSSIVMYNVKIIFYVKLMDTHVDGNLYNYRITIDRGNTRTIYGNEVTNNQVQGSLRMYPLTGTHVII